jgi:MGT family glycosyltransferase
MSRALFVNIPGHGHVNPTLPVAAELVARGEHVDYAVTPDFAAAVAQTGARLVAYESILPQILSPPAGADGPAAMLDRRAAFQLPLKLLEDALHVMPQLLEAVAAMDAPPDYVVHDPFSVPGRILAERFGIPRIQTHCTYVFGGASLQQPAFRRLQQFAEGARDRFDAFDRVSRELADRFGVTPLSARDVFTGAAPFNVVFLPRAFQPGGEAFGDRWAFVGPSIGPRGNGTDGAAGLMDELSRLGDGPLLFVSLGTVFNDQLAFYRTVLDAFAGTGWRVLVAAGSRVDLEAIGPVPANAVVRRHVPQIEVLAHARAFVSHGGMNSTMESIVAEVPLVVVPQMPEQGVTADRVAELGLGVALEPGEVTAASIVEAVSSVASDREVRSRLAGMHQASVEAGGPARAAEQILAHLA